MKKRQTMHYFAIFLCLWLPLQAVAGQWLNCAQLQTKLKQLDDSAAEALVTPSELAPCHQPASNERSLEVNKSAQNASQLAPDSCKHCQFMCHWHCMLVIENPVLFGIDTRSFFIPFISPSAPQPLLEQPQRPPQALIV